ncbi:MAG: transcriptional repressor [Clostridia bacterium]
MNYSRQREVILNVLRSTTSHPTAEWIYEQSKNILPSISLATVYRNLAYLEQLHEIIKVQGVFEKDRYDGNTKNHAHFVCLVCGNVIDTDVDSDTKVKILTSIPEKADTFSIIFSGVCQKCREKSNNPN